MSIQATNNTAQNLPVYDILLLRCWCNSVQYGSFSSECVVEHSVGRRCNGLKYTPNPEYTPGYILA